MLGNLGLVKQFYCYSGEGDRILKNAFFALKIVFLGPKFPKISPKIFREGQSAFFGFQRGEGDKFFRLMGSKVGLGV